MTALFDPRIVGIGLNPSENALAESLPVVLHAPTYNALHDLGIHGRAITGADMFDALHVEPVVFLERGRFEMARDLHDQSDATLAVIIPVREDGGAVDMA